MAEVDQMATEQLTSHGKIDLKDNFFDHPSSFYPTKFCGIL